MSGLAVEAEQANSKWSLLGILHGEKGRFLCARPSLSMEKAVTRLSLEALQSPLIKANLEIRMLIYTIQLIRKTLDYI